MPIRFAAPALILALVSACGEHTASVDPSSPTPTTSPTDRVAKLPTRTATGASAPSASPGRTDSGTRIVAASSAFGPMLFDGRGQAIYLFDIETTSEARCYDACAEAWPPVLTTGEPVAGRGASRSLLGTTERADGSLQVTYNDHPLYFYAHEGRREVRCHDVFLNGGNWYVVQPGGDAAPPG